MWRLPVNRHLCGFVLFFASGLVFYLSPSHYVTDSAYSMLMDEAILRRGTPSMLAYRVPRGDGPGFLNGYPLHLMLYNGRLVYAFPWGAPLLSLPAVAMVEAAGFQVAPGRVYNVGNEIRLQSALSAVVSASTLWLLFETAIVFLPLGWSVGLALGAAFCTQIWSTVSRSLWPQTWYLFLISAAILLLARKSRRPVLLATLLAWACLTRPAAVPGVIIVGLYTVYACGSAGERMVLVGTGALWTAALAAMLLTFTGRLLAPVYHPGWFVFTHGMAAHLGGLLFSPSRGLLIYTPCVLIPFYLAIRYRATLPRPGLALLSIAMFAATSGVLIFFPIWWGGWCYGPRQLADTVPWLVLLAVLGLRAARDAPPPAAIVRRLEVTASALLLAVSLALNAAGALSPAAMDWNALPPLETHMDRLWDWRHPPFLAWIQLQR